MAVQALTIYQDDDITPLVGAVDANGVITVPTFSTDIAHPRPWLEKETQGVSATINLIEGTATIAQFSLTVLDHRTVPTDQTTGYVTSLLAGPNGFSALIMRRAVYQIQGPDGVFRVVQNGVITEVKLNADLSSYTFQIRDMHERARKAKLFNKLTGPTPRYTIAQAPAFLQTAGPGGVTYPTAPFYAFDPIPGPLPPYGSGLMPLGPLNGYILKGTLALDPLAGFKKEYQIPPLVPLTGVFLRDVKGHNTMRGAIRFDTRSAKPLTGIDNATAAALAAGYPQVAIDQSQANQGTVTLYPTLIYTDLVVFWRKTGGTAWHRVENMPYRRLDTFPTNNPLGFVGGELSYPQQLFLTNPANAGFPGTPTTLTGETPGDGHVYMMMTFATPNHQDMPADQEAIDVLVMDNGAPSATSPLYLEGTWGQVLADIHDGQYTIGVLNDPEPLFPLGSGLNRPVFAGLANSTPWIRGRIFAPVDDAFNWLPENFYKPFGAVPTFDRNGLLSPIFYALPDVSATLTVLDDTNCSAEGSSWNMTANGAVNEVTFTYKREFIQQQARDAHLLPLERLASKDVPLAFYDITAERLGGEKPVVYAPAIVTGFSDLYEGIVPNGDTSSELGTQLAMQRWHEVQNRFRFGNQLVTFLCDRNDPGVEALVAGAWCLVGVSWMPDFRSGTRGMNRLMQAVGVRDLDESWKEVQLADAGPAGQPAVPPILGALTANADGTISVPVTAVQPGTKCVIAYIAVAPGEVRPNASDGRWAFLGATATPQTVLSIAMPSGATVWVRARSESTGGSGSTGTGSQILATITLAPSPLALTVGSADVAVTATARDTTGAVVSGRTVSATSGDATKMTVSPATGTSDPNGQVVFTVHAVAAGSATLTVTSGSVSASDAVTVAAAAGPYGISTQPVAWWKRDSLTALANGASVTSWADSSPSGWTVTTDVTAPTWNTGILGGAVDFSNQLGRLRSAAFNSLNGTAAFTKFIVMRLASASNGSISGADGFGGAADYNYNGAIFSYVGSANNGSFAFTDTTAGHVFEQVFDGTAAGNAARLAALLDGTAKALAFTGTIPATTGAVTNGYEIGHVNGDASEASTYVVEILIFPVALSSADRSTVRVALGAKYGITVTP